MKKLHIVLLSITVALATACHTTAPTTTFMDPISGLRTDLMGENLLDTKEPAREMVWLSASRMFKKGGGSTCYLEVHHAANSETGPLDIYPGKTLAIIADGKETKFGGIGSTNTRRTKKGVIHEDAIYEATEADIKAIADAKAVTVKITGKSAVVTREFGPENFDKFRKFVDQIQQAPPAKLPFK